MFYERIPNISELRTFGCLAYMPIFLMKRDRSWTRKQENAS
jgi:hypothetical protein